MSGSVLQVGINQGSLGARATDDFSTSKISIQTLD